MFRHLAQMGAAFFFFQSILLFPGSGYGVEPGEGIDDILKEFEAESAFEQLPSPDPMPPKNDTAKSENALSHTFSATISIEAIYAFQSHSSLSENTDYEGLTSLNSRLDMALGVRKGGRFRATASGHGFYDSAFAIEGRENYTRETLEAYEDELELDEAFLGASFFSGGDISIGRQVVSLSKFDMLHAFAMFNPTDLRKPGLTPVENISLPVGMSRLDYSFDTWRLTGLVTHEFRLNKYPPYGSDFYPFDFRLPPVEKPDSGFDRQSYGILAATLVNGWDVNLLLSSYLAERSLIGINEDTPMRRFDRHSALDLSADQVFGDWLVKFEGALSDNHRFYALEGQEALRLDFLAGIEYNGYLNTKISVELLYRHFFDFDPEAAGSDDVPGKDGLAWAVSLKKNYLNDLLRCSFSTLNLGVDFSKGGISKLTAAYFLSDNLSLKGGVVLYSNGDKYPFEHIGNNDRVFLKLQYFY